jgi:hypothetical protein
MKKTIKLSESDLIKVIKKVIIEQTQESQCTKQEYLEMEKEYNKTLSEIGVNPKEINNSNIPSGLDGNQKMKLKEIVQKMEKMDKTQLKNLLKELVIHKKQPINESRKGGHSDLGPTLTLLGVGAAAWLLAGPIVAFLIAVALVILSKRIFRGPCASRGPRRGTFRR